MAEPRRACRLGRPNQMTHCRVRCSHCASERGLFLRRCQPGGFAVGLC
jgi:hypothetical protein